MSWEAWGTDEPPPMRKCYGCDGTGGPDDDPCEVCNGEGEIVGEYDDEPCREEFE